MGLSQTSLLRMTSDLMLPRPVILVSQNATSAVNGATTEPRIRINRPADENARCRVSRVQVQPKNFSQPTQPPTTLSTFSAISPQQERTESSGPRRCRRGAKSSLRREPNMPADLLRALFGNVTVPALGLEPKATQCLEMLDRSQKSPSGAAAPVNIARCHTLNRGRGTQPNDLGYRP